MKKEANAQRPTPNAQRPEGKHWATAKPNKPGWYWCYNPEGDYPGQTWLAVVRVDETPAGLRCSWMKAPGESGIMLAQEWSPNCLWCGPITPAKGLTERGERIPPIPGDPPCAEYDPAGEGAGLEFDGHPQCAACGWPKKFHESATTDELRIALHQSVKLQSHYAKLLNDYDGGERIPFADENAWLAVLRANGTIPKKSAPSAKSADKP